MDLEQSLDGLRPKQAVFDNNLIFWINTLKWFKKCLNILQKGNSYIDIIRQIFYNVNRTLDSILMGEASVNCIPKSQLY